MNLFETNGGEFINLDQVTRFETGADHITLHFDGENELTLRNDDARRLTQMLAKLAADVGRRAPKG